jgi:outer membrane murein-binding lipoprotein Lpp
MQFMARVEKTSADIQTLTVKVEKNSADILSLAEKLDAKAGASRVSAVEQRVEALESSVG